MDNKQKYAGVFEKVFQLSPQQLDNLTYQGIPAWDSVGHMALVAALEEAFDIMLDTDDILNLNSFAHGMEILKKYDIQF